MMLRKHSLCLLAALALPACASTTSDYPSLSIRDAERQTAIMQPPAPEPSPAPPAAVSADRLEQLKQEAASANQAFQGKVAAAQKTVSAARGARLDSDGWANAQLAIGDLETSRAQAMIALTDLDTLYVEAMTQGSDVQAIDQTRLGVAAQVDNQTRLIDSLLGQLGGG